MSERPIVRCYECPNYSGGKYRGKCRELKTKVEAVDWCYRDEVKALRKEAIETLTTIITTLQNLGDPQPKEKEISK